MSKNEFKVLSGCAQTSHHKKIVSDYQDTMIEKFYQKLPKQFTYSNSIEFEIYETGKDSTLGILYCAVIDSSDDAVIIDEQLKLYINSMRFTDPVDLIAFVYKTLMQSNL